MVINIFMLFLYLVYFSWKYSRCSRRRLPHPVDLSRNRLCVSAAGARLLCWPGGWLPALPYLCWRRGCPDQVWFPLSQRNFVWPAVLCLQLVVQCWLLPGIIKYVRSLFEKFRICSKANRLYKDFSFCCYVSYISLI